MQMKKYNILYLDPPWKYRQKNLHGAAEHHYNTLSVEEICNLKRSYTIRRSKTLYMFFEREINLIVSVSKWHD